MNQPHALIIDDNRTNVMVLAALLTQHGLTYTSVTNPSEVLTKLGEFERLDVVFLDLEMPRLNGYEVLQLIQADPMHANVPVVACTVHVSEVAAAYDAGFHSFLPKPLDSNQFGDQLSRILSGERLWVRM